MVGFQARSFETSLNTGLPVGRRKRPKDFGARPLRTGFPFRGAAAIPETVADAPINALTLAKSSREICKARPLRNAANPPSRGADAPDRGELRLDSATRPVSPLRQIG
jgi:hypothetical protein